MSNKDHDGGVPRPHLQGFMHRRRPLAAGEELPPRQDLAARMLELSKRKRAPIRSPQRQAGDYAEDSTTTAVEDDENEP
jgi:hypothetical protein